MKTFLKKTGIIIIGSMFIATLVSFGSLYVLRKSSFYKPSFVVNAITETELDYIILGASTGLTTLNTKTIDKITGTKGINLSMDDTALASQYLMLQHFLAQGKKVNYVILSPSAASFNSKNEGLSDNDYRFMMYVNKPWVYNYYKEHKGHEAKVMRFSKWLPFAGVSYFNAELFYPSLLSAIQPQKRNRFDDRGNYTYPIISNRKYKVSEIKSYEVVFLSEYFKKIRALCEKQNIKLICYFSPIEDTQVSAEPSDYFKIVNHSRLINNSAHFYDTNHVNSNGREVASEAFAKEFLEITKNTP